jgi:hypothetical protein
MFRAQLETLETTASLPRLYGPGTWRQSVAEARERASREAALYASQMGERRAITKLCGTASPSDESGFAVISYRVGLLESINQFFPQTLYSYSSLTMRMGALAHWRSDESEGIGIRAEDGEGW